MIIKFYNQLFSRCIERPLICDDKLCLENDLLTVTTLSDCNNLLFTELDDKKIFNELNNYITTFITTHKNIETIPPILQQKLIENLYHECLDKIQIDKKINEKTFKNYHYNKTIKISVESYVLYGLRNVLRNIVSINTTENDAEFNKIIKNIYDFELNDFNIEFDRQVDITRGKIELSRLDSFITILGKIGCLKRAIRCVTENIDNFTTDNLLPILIYLIIKTALPNWLGQLNFLKNYRFSLDKNSDNDETSFIITSLEASIEHIKSGKIKPSDIKIYDNENNIINSLFKAVKNCNIETIDSIINKKYKIQKLKLCHPLCRCDKCEINYCKLQVTELNNNSLINIKDSKGRTALHIASICGQIKIVDYLLQQCANTNIQDNNGLTPLHCASIRGHQNTLLLLLHANCDSTIIDNYGNTSLHYATDYGHDTCVKALLYFTEQNRIIIDINSRNKNGDTPLHLASKWGYTIIVDILLEHGANTRIKNKKGQLPSTIAYSKKIIQHLDNPVNNIHPVIKVKINKSDCKKNSVKKREIIEKNYCKIDKLMRAINQGDVGLACYYLGLEKSNVITKELNGKNLCHPLCDCEKCGGRNDEQFDNNKVHEISLNLNVVNSRGETPLHLACFNGLANFVGILLDAGANVNAITIIERRTSLHIACNIGIIKVVKLLLNCQTININAKDYLGDTSLHLAAKNGFIKIVEMLLRHDVDKNIRNYKGSTAAEEVQERIKKDELPSQTFVDILNALKNHVT